MRSRFSFSLRSLYRLFSRLSSKLQSPFLLAVRLYWGWQFAQSGWGKLTASTTSPNSSPA